MDVQIPQKMTYCLHLTSVATADTRIFKCSQNRASFCFWFFISRSLVLRIIFRHNDLYCFRYISHAIATVCVCVFFPKIRYHLNVMRCLKILVNSLTSVPSPLKKLSTWTRSLSLIAPPVSGLSMCMSGEPV